MIQENQKVAQLHSIAMQQCNSETETRNTLRNSNATISLKALATKALQRNTQRNFCATNAENQRNFEAIKTPQKLRELHSFIKATYGVSLEEVRTFLGEDWELYQDNAEALICWAKEIKERKASRGRNND